VAERTIENLLQEDRTFPPSSDFTSRANAKPGLHEEAAADPVAYWEAQARNRITWFKEPTALLDDSNPPFFKWFSDGELNVTYNCIDRHIEAGRGDKVAFYWEGEPGDERVLTYQDLYDEVCRFANGLRSIGVKKGDRIAGISNVVQGGSRHRGLGLPERYSEAEGGTTVGPATDEVFMRDYMRVYRRLMQTEPNIAPTRDVS